MSHKLTPEEAAAIAKMTKKLKKEEGQKEDKAYSDACCEPCALIRLTDDELGSTELYALAAEKKKPPRPLNKPFRTPKGPKKFSVYVKNDKGNIVKVNFGDPNMEIKRDDPGRRKNFRARHNCESPGPKWKARYWSCRMWEKSAPVSKVAGGAKAIRTSHDQGHRHTVPRDAVLGLIKSGHTTYEHGHYHAFRWVEDFGGYLIIEDAEDGHSHMAFDYF